MTVTNTHITDDGMYSLFIETLENYNCDDHTYKEVTQALRALLSHDNYIKTIRNFNDNTTGFAWSSDTDVTNIGKLLEFQGHSGASFAITLRMCQRIFRDVIDEDCNIYNL